MRPSTRTSPVGNSLVGTLAGLGLLLAMVTTGVALMTTTERRSEPAADIRFQGASFTHCPAEVRADAEDPATLRCATVPVRNQGQIEGIAKCVLVDAKGVARFDLNDTHIFSLSMAPDVTEDLLVRIEGVRNPSLPVVGCNSVPLPRT